MRYLLALFTVLLTASPLVFAQKPESKTSAEIYHDLEKLNFLGTALYIAAHPDDENTRLIAYLANEVKARTAYLSITRGDGGQNLIGPELRELLGVLRTQELLAARRVDGGEQYFTRANDFGYSKHPNETLKLWDKEEVLGDVVRIIRKLRPDVIINRFDHRRAGRTHGHHTSSALLSLEAFDLVGDKGAYPEQLEPWQPKRLFFNTSWWFYGSRENFEKADKSTMLNVDIGVYYPLLGKSNNEIASVASSQHLCQGFGRLSTRGSTQEYLELLQGDMPDNGDIFQGINTTWSRVQGGEAIGDIIEGILEDFNFQNPAAHLDGLLRAHELIGELEDAYWRTYKLGEIEDIITAVCGLYLEASTEDPISTPGSSVSVKFEALNRSAADIELNSIAINEQVVLTTDAALPENQRKNFEFQLTIPSGTGYTSPYWLTEEGSVGMYKVSDPELIGKPETPRAFMATFNLEMEGYEIAITKPLVYRYARNDKGELYRPFEILPPVTANFSDKVIIFSKSGTRQIPVNITALKDSVSGFLNVKAPEGWVVNEQQIPFRIDSKNEDQTVVLTVTPPENTSEGKLMARMEVNGKTYSKELITIAYDHIPTQSVLVPATTKVVRLDIAKRGEHIGYIMGAGDEVPESLEQMGYVVHQVNADDIHPGSLDKYDAVVTGIRAYNVLPELKLKQQYVLEYVKQGGTLIVQYNTAGRWDAPYKEIAPYPLSLSRTRVTDENSPVTLINDDHELLNFPNAISERDFEGWVQERGLYFPDSWDPQFTPVLELTDNGEEPVRGSLLVAPYGKGHYIYTGLSFFRELPAGVPGAYKIFANMLSIGKENLSNEDNIKG